MSTIIEIFTYPFMVRALLVGLAISFCAALVGVSLVLRKNSMLSDGLSHTAFGAFAVAVVLGATPFWFALPIVVIASILILYYSKSKTSHGDAAIALLSASSLAIGTMAISMSKGVNVDFNSFLFGSILSVNIADVWLSLGMVVLVTVFYLFSYNRIFAITFDEEFAKSIGIKTNFYDIVFATICSFVIVLGMRLLGALLISSLIIFPTITAMQFSRSFKSVVFYSVIISTAAFLVGLIVSYLIAAPTSATVVIVNLIALCIAFLLRKIFQSI